MRAHNTSEALESQRELIILGFVADSNLPFRLGAEEVSNAHESHTNTP